MTITVGGSVITFSDATTQSTAANVTTTSVLNATAGASVGAVGTYALMVNVSSPIPVGSTPGTTQSGSILRYAYAFNLNTSAGTGYPSITPSGTWRCMGWDASYYCGGCPPQKLYATTLWLRIA